jgi:hypothetical protein
MVSPSYTHKIKGGCYIYLMIAKPAGTAKDSEQKAVFYRCVDTGEVYWRYEQDFNDSMQKLPFDAE